MPIIDLTNHYEIIAAYFVDKTYNSLYSLAKKYKDQNKYDTITDAYININISYCLSFSKLDVMKRLINDIHTYFKETTKFHEVTITQYLFDFATQFIQSEYKNNLRQDQIISLFINIISTCTKRYIKYIISAEVLPYIIDGNGSLVSNNSRMCQDIYIDCLKNQKEILREKFNNTLLNDTDTNEKKIYNLISMASKLKADIVELKKIIAIKDGTIKKQNEIITTLNNKLQYNTTRNDRVSIESKSMNNAVDIAPNKTKMIPQRNNIVTKTRNMQNDNKFIVHDSSNDIENVIKNNIENNTNINDLLVSNNTNDKTDDIDIDNILNDITDDNNLVIDEKNDGFDDNIDEFSELDFDIDEDFDNVKKPKKTKTKKELVIT